ncbi:MAG: ATP-binding cassette domain-containing protein [Candidatus Caldarchaeales archaeon]|nr:ATP-binding cassette domain-containing protein [Candidatus Caldarchaeales archaeon]
MRRVLEIRGLSIRRWGLSIYVERMVVESRTVIVGRNGSGKTSLLRCIMGFYRPDSGRILLNGADITSLPPGERRLGYLPQHPVKLPFRPQEQLRYFAKLYGADPAHVIERLGLERISQGAGLSAGELQLLNLATVLLKDPEALLLDEPVSSIDFTQKVRVIRHIRRLGKPLIYVTHDPIEALLVADELFLMRDGRLWGPVPNEWYESAENALSELDLYVLLARRAQRPA